MADPELIFRPNTVTKYMGALQVIGVTTNYTLHFGDGASRAGRPNQNHNYTWPSAGPYTAVLVRDGESVPFVKKAFRILEQPSPNVTVSVPTDVDYTARVTFNDPADGPVGRFEITWAKGETAHEVIGVPGTSVDHYYPTVGTHQLRVSDLWSGYRSTFPVDIVEPSYNPDLTATEDTTDPERYTVKLEVTHSTGAADRKLTVDWSDGASQEISAAVGTTVSHQFGFADDYLIAAYYSDDIDGQHRYLPITLPFGTEPAA